MNGAYASNFKNVLILYQGKKGMVYRLRDFFFTFDESIYKSMQHPGDPQREKYDN